MRKAARAGKVGKVGRKKEGNLYGETQRAARRCFLLLASVGRRVQVLLSMVTLGVKGTISCRLILCILGGNAWDTSASQPIHEKITRLPRSFLMIPRLSSFMLIAELDTPAPFVSPYWLCYSLLLSFAVLLCILLYFPAPISNSFASDLFIPHAQHCFITIRHA